MLINIFFKHAGEKPEKISSDIDLEEFRRLTSDYESFLKTGLPRTGVYKCKTAHGDPNLRQNRPVLLSFDEILFIR